MNDKKRRQLEHEGNIDRFIQEVEGNIGHLYNQTEDKIKSIIEQYDFKGNNLSVDATLEDNVNLYEQIKYTLDNEPTSPIGRRKLNELEPISLTKEDVLINQVDIDIVKLGNNEELKIKQWKEQAGLTKLNTERLEYQLDSIPTKDVDNFITQAVNKEYYGHNYSERVWSRIDEVRDYTRSTLYDYASKGKDPRELVDEIKDLFDVSSFEAERLAVTEYGNMQSEATTEIMNQAGYEEYDVIPETGACERCMNIAKNGPYKVAEREIGVNAEMIHPYCRCISVGVE